MLKTPAPNGNRTANAAHTAAKWKMNLKFAAITYRSIRDRIPIGRSCIDEQALADTVEGLTICRDRHRHYPSALADEALATGLKGRIAEMQERLEACRGGPPNVARSPKR